MADGTAQLQWTKEQWARVQQVVREQAQTNRVAAKFLPVHGPLDPNVSFVPAEVLNNLTTPSVTPSYTDRPLLEVDDTDTVELVPLEARVHLRPPQVADPKLTSALIAFARAANHIARMEDLLIFQQSSKSLSMGAHPVAVGTSDLGDVIVRTVSDQVQKFEKASFLGPFACVLGQELFDAVASAGLSHVLGLRRILPYLRGDALLRSSVLEPRLCVMVALGGAPLDLVRGTDITVELLQVTDDPFFVFRVYETIALRVRELGAIKAFHFVPDGRLTRFWRRLRGH